MSFNILSVDTLNMTMIIDWGDVCLNHSIPPALYAGNGLNEAEVLEVIRSMHPVPKESVDINENVFAHITPMQAGTENEIIAGEVLV